MYRKKPFEVLPSYIKTVQPVLEIFRMVGYIFRPHMYSLVLLVVTCNFTYMVKVVMCVMFLVNVFVSNCCEGEYFSTNSVTTLNDVITPLFHYVPLIILT